MNTLSDTSTSETPFSPSSEITKPPKTVKVWDPLVRVFHWSLVVFFFIAYFTEDDFQTLHTWAGYTVAALVGFRVVWGLIGSRHARFSDFVRTPKNIWRYVVAIPAGKAKRYIGHNPAGGAMVIALLLSLTGNTVFGMALYGADENAGPLAGTWLATFNEHTLKEIHEFFANFTLALVGLHVTGVIFSSLHHKENLVKAMVKGRKQMRADDFGSDVSTNSSISQIKE
ncbi:MAG: cytochrome b/b6 domain-containing protein [Oleibacter sp.]|nr:cytochrome b/b6 domain-containing protein [Thalassolituus sp.]